MSLRDRGSRPQGLVTALLHDHEAIIRSLRVDLETTADRYITMQAPTTS